MIVQNGFYPSMLAIAERAWRGGGTEYFDGNGTMLPAEDTETFMNLLILKSYVMA